ncbi:MAG: hypothetical protein JWP02_1074 [Acidimicrobiales bacterium]|nr:hypothetical protein [Acidimicrobiales bacterium]
MAVRAQSHRFGVGGPCYVGDVTGTADGAEVLRGGVLPRQEPPVPFGLDGGHDNLLPRRGSLLDTGDNSQITRSVNPRSAQGCGWSRWPGRPAPDEVGARCATSTGSTSATDPDLGARSVQNSGRRYGGTRSGPESGDRRSSARVSAMNSASTTCGTRPWPSPSLKVPIRRRFRPAWATPRSRSPSTAMATCSPDSIKKSRTVSTPCTERTPDVLRPEDAAAG